MLAVDHIDLEVVKGEFFSLLGPSGCGKTTTLRMIGGFEQPTSGLIELAGRGRHLAAALPAARQHGLPELRAVPPPHDLRERRLRAAPDGVKDSEIKSRVADMLELVELPGFEKRKPTQISGGQAQRVALARALINRPAVLLLDEPLGALDLKLRKQMQVELKRIQQEVGITFIYVTHDQEEAMTMSDRIAVMNKGQLRAAGRPGDAVRAPDDALRGRLPGRQQPARRDVRGHAATAGASSASPTTRWSWRPPRRSTGATTVDVGVRPEKIRLHHDDRPDAGRAQPPGGRRRGRLVHGRQHAVHRRDPRRGAGHGLRAEHRTRRPRTSCGPAATRSHLTWSPDHTFVVDATGEPAAATPATSTRTWRRHPVDRETLTSTPITRRRVLAGGALAGVAAFLAACGTKGTAATAPPIGRGRRERRAAGLRRRRAERRRRPSGLGGRGPGRHAVDRAELGELDLLHGRRSQRPDQAPDARRRSRPKYGDEVNYQEVIDGNDEFVATIQPALKAGKDTGWDLITLTDWMAAEADPPAAGSRSSTRRTCPTSIANLKDVYREPALGPGQQPPRPVAVRHDRPRLQRRRDRRRHQPGGAVTVDPKTKGKVEYLTEMRDAIGLSMLYLGLDPANPDARRRRQGRRPDAEGQGRRRHPRRQGPVVHDRPRPRATRCSRWPGRATCRPAPIDDPSLRYNLATEGGMLWTDNMLIPKGAAAQGHGRADDQLLLRPGLQRDPDRLRRLHLAGQGHRRADDRGRPRRGRQPVRDPAARRVARLHIFGALSEEDDLYFNEQFAKVIGVG